jgi:F-type H+-transporting ATPase subunit delta
MKNRKLSKRYAQGLINSIADEKEYTAISSQIKEIDRIFSDNKELNSIFKQPFLSTAKKKQLAKEILDRMTLSAKVERFILLLLEHDRLELFSNILELLPDMWNEKKGISTFEVTSVIPLTEGQIQKLSTKLEKMEKVPVALKFKQDPSLIGGLSIKKGNVVYDVSLKGDLDKLMDKIKQG